MNVIRIARPLLVLILFLCVAISPVVRLPTVIYAQTNEPFRPLPNPASEPVQPQQWNTVYELSDFAANHINTYWYNQFTAAGYIYSPPGFGYFIEPLPCGDTMLSLQNAWYCPAGNFIVYDPNFFYSQWTEFGDFAVFTILAHEWGHLVQAHFGILSEYQELQADCFAGNYALYAEQSGILDEGDLQEAVNALFMLGNPNLPAFSPNTHGRPEERNNAFNFGYSYGPDACFTYYTGRPGTGTGGAGFTGGYHSVYLPVVIR